MPAQRLPLGTCFWVPNMWNLDQAVILLGLPVHSSALPPQLALLPAAMPLLYRAPQGSHHPLQPESSHSLLSDHNSYGPTFA